LSRNTSKFSQVRLEITEMTGSDTSRAPNICKVKEYNKARLEITEMTGSDTSRAPNICRVKEYKRTD
jgi:hypothetical protein